MGAFNAYMDAGGQKKVAAFVFGMPERFYP